VVAINKKPPFLGVLYATGGGGLGYACTVRGFGVMSVLRNRREQYIKFPRLFKMGQQSNGSFTVPPSAAKALSRVNSGRLKLRRIGRKPKGTELLYLNHYRVTGHREQITFAGYGFSCPNIRVLGHISNYKGVKL